MRFVCSRSRKAQTQATRPASRKCFGSQAKPRQRLPAGQQWLLSAKQTGAGLPARPRASGGQQAAGRPGEACCFRSARGNYEPPGRPGTRGLSLLASKGRAAAKGRRPCPRPLAPAGAFHQPAAQRQSANQRGEALRSKRSRCSRIPGSRSERSERRRRKRTENSAARRSTINQDAVFAQDRAKRGPSKKVKEKRFC